MIPEKSQASILEGMWFIYEDGTNIIKIWSSSINGKEKVFLNNELVSDQRSFKMKSDHFFKDNNGIDYKVSFITTSIMKGKLECVIFRNIEKVKTFKLKYVQGKNYYLKRFFILVLVTIIFAIVKIQLNLPEISFFIFLTIVLVVHFRTRDNGDLVIEE